MVLLRDDYHIYFFYIDLIQKLCKLEVEKKHLFLIFDKNPNETLDEQPIGPRWNHHQF